MGGQGLGEGGGPHIPGLLQYALNNLIKHILNKLTLCGMNFHNFASNNNNYIHKEFPQLFRNYVNQNLI